MRAIDGWVLDRAVEVETAHPFSGFMRRLTTAGVLRRQAVFAALATAAGCDVDAHDFDPDRLLTLDVRSLLREAFGDLPPGVVGSLLRLGPFPLAQESYGRLARLLSGDRQRAHLLRHLPLSDERLKVVETLPVPLLHVSFAAKVLRAQDAEDLAHVLQHIRQACPSVTEEAIAESAAATSREPPDWARSWFDRAEAFVKPVELPEPLFRHVRNAADLQETARRFANCMAWGFHAANCVAGCNSFFEYRPEGEPPAVLNLQRGGGRWWLSGIFGRQNARVSEGTRVFVEDVLSRLGIQPLVMDSPAEWRRTIRFIRGRDDDGGLDFDLAA